MVSVFLDTTEDLQVGLLNSSFDWLEFQKIQDKRNTAKFHEVIYEILRQNHLKIQQVSNFFHIAGPGNYTGIRLSKGVTNILELFGKKIYSFYHYQIPKFLNISEGYWVSKAYKGELFVYSWKEDEINLELMNYNRFQENFEKNFDLFPERFFSNSVQSLSNIPFPRSNLFFLSTSDLIKNRSNEIFPKIYKLKLRENSYYYRPLEKEFKCFIG